MARDYYEVLGVPRSADKKEIRSAFRKLARQYHPDLNPGDEAAERMFKEINEANDVLSDSDKRAKYNRHGDNWMRADRIEAQGGAGSPFGGGSGRRTRVEYGFGDLDDLLGGFGDAFGTGSPYGTGSRTRRRSRPGRPNHHDVPVTITLEEAFRGSRRMMNVPTNDGNTRRIEVSIPPAVDNGSRVHISLDDGAQVFLVVSVSNPYTRFKREGDNLYADIALPFEDALLGGEVEFTSLKGRLALKVPSASGDGRRIRIQGHGMPMRESPSANGDLYLTVKPQMPTSLSDDERASLEEFKRLRIANGRRS